MHGRSVTTCFADRPGPSVETVAAILQHRSGAGHLRVPISRAIEGSTGSLRAKHKNDQGAVPVSTAEGSPENMHLISRVGPHVLTAPGQCAITDDVTFRNERDLHPDPGVLALLLLVLGGSIVLPSGTASQET
jgi:hypothetical protein